jgi:S-adenosylmethionine synthetase
VDDAALTEAVGKVFDLRPASIIAALDLKQPIYERTAYHGHFGRPEFSWERTDRVQQLQAEVGAHAGKGA